MYRNSQPRRKGDLSRSQWNPGYFTELILRQFIFSTKAIIAQVTLPSSGSQIKRLLSVFNNTVIILRGAGIPKVVPNIDTNFNLKQLHILRMTYLKTAMMAALITPEMGTVTNQAIKMLRKRRQSTAFLDRSQPTDTTEPT